MYGTFSIQFELNGRFRLKLVKIRENRKWLRGSTGEQGKSTSEHRESKGSIEGVEESSEEA